VALAASKLPARRVYPASVFEKWPQLLERPRALQKGSITAFYTVLLESGGEEDRIGDAIHSILDGNIYLSAKLAGRAHYPAIDILNSISHVFSRVTTLPPRQAAAPMRDMLGRLAQIQLYLDLGEYQHGENAENDRALERKEAIEALLRQLMDFSIDFSDTLSQLKALTA